MFLSAPQPLHNGSKVSHKGTKALLLVLDHKGIVNCKGKFQIFCQSNYILHSLHRSISFTYGYSVVMDSLSRLMGSHEGKNILGKLCSKLPHLTLMKKNLRWVLKGSLTVHLEFLLSYACSGPYVNKNNALDSGKGELARLSHFVFVMNSVGL